MTSTDNIDSLCGSLYDLIKDGKIDKLCFQNQIRHYCGELIRITENISETSLSSIDREKRMLDFGDKIHLKFNADLLESK